MTGPREETRSSLVGWFSGCENRKTLPTWRLKVGHNIPSLKEEQRAAPEAYVKCQLELLRCYQLAPLAV